MIYLVCMGMCLCAFAVAHMSGDKSVLCCQSSSGRQLDSRALIGTSTCKHSVFSLFGMLEREDFFPYGFERVSHYVVQAGLQLLASIHTPIAEVIGIVNSSM